MEERSSCRTGGFALLIVLWVLVLIGLIAGHVASVGRTEILIANNLSNNAQAQAARDGAIDATIFNLLKPPDQHWVADGEPHIFNIGASKVIVRITDEAGRVNPNLASQQLLEALFLATGNDPDTARQLAIAIDQWIGTNKTGARGDDVAREYEAAGLDYAPPVEPIQTIEELKQVIGMSPDIVNTLRPHLTLYGPAQPNPAVADPAVIAALTLLQEGRISTGNPRTPSQIEEGPRALRIFARADGPRDAVSSATVIVRLTDMQTQPYVLQSWEDDSID